MYFCMYGNVNSDVWYGPCNLYELGLHLMTYLDELINWSFFRGDNCYNIHV